MIHQVSVCNHGLCSGADDVDDFSAGNASVPWLMVLMMVSTILAALCFVNIRCTATGTNEEADVELGQQSLLPAPASVEFVEDNVATVTQRTDDGAAAVIRKHEITHKHTFAFLVFGWPFRIPPSRPQDTLDL